MFAKKLLHKAVHHHFNHKFQQPGSLQSTELDPRIVIHYGIPSSTSPSIPRTWSNLESGFLKLTESEFRRGGYRGEMVVQARKLNGCFDHHMETNIVCQPGSFFNALQKPITSGIVGTLASFPARITWNLMKELR
ncbi:hypothetical protein KIW84_051674 [Lathyrus oleraceus]|uniref:Uncharacterized protein n=1 Tax=Pisum sativum TaxID=3888 RepID=A0A9D5AAZ2_PEA|nr:hypothetical protein KIW84_051674 [Pisum sativum]